MAQATAAAPNGAVVGSQAVPHCIIFPSHVCTQLALHLLQSCMAGARSRPASMPRSLLCLKKRRHTWGLKLCLSAPGLQRRTWSSISLAVLTSESHPLHPQPSFPRTPQRMQHCYPCVFTHISRLPSEIAFFLLVVRFFFCFCGVFFKWGVGDGVYPPPTTHLSCDNSCQGDEGKSSLCENKTLLLSV